MTPQEIVVELGKLLDAGNEFDAERAASIVLRAAGELRTLRCEHRDEALVVRTGDGATASGPAPGQRSKFRMLAAWFANHLEAREGTLYEASGSLGTESGGRILVTVRNTTAEQSVELSASLEDSS